ncbi:MAG TPA: glycosyltransferase [Candidatus Dormibacteraeota bacterium]|nr:glycosyltransferase [Candidatus Dormibacteraeota bacterium]
MSRRRVMVVAYNFPPVAGTGIERTIKHVIYLPDHGWQPVVVAPANPAARVVDRASLVRVPTGTEVHRAPSLEPAHARGLMRRLLRKDAADVQAGSASATASDAGGSTALRRLLNAAWARIIPALFFPDEQLLWVPSAVAVGWRAHRRHPVDVLYSSAPPFSSHVAAGLLKARIGVPWIADFRDPWIGNSYARPLGPVHRRMQAALERWMVHRADRVVFSTARMGEYYAARYPDRADRFVVIPNGYDLADLEAAEASVSRDDRTDDGTFRLLNAGSLHGADELPLFLDGVERLLARRPELADRLRVEFLGWFSAANETLAARRLPGLAPVVQHVDFLPRDEAIPRLAAADAALLLMADAPGRDQVVGTRLYEYIGLDKPILAVIPPGEARRTLEQLDWGIVADPTPEGVAEGLGRILEAPAPGRRADPERAYERRTLTARLARIFDELAPEGTGGQ